MANRTVFRNAGKGRVAPPTNTVNEAGGVAYNLTDQAALAQLAVTGCFGNTFYVSAESQLEKVLDLCKRNDPTFVAKTAVYAREFGYMKDMPALLVAYLTANAETAGLVERYGLFNRVIDNGRMLRNFVQMIRSGQLGRKSLGSRPKRIVQNRLNSWRPDQVWRYSIGTNPSMADVLKLARPKPVSKAHEAVYAYLLGKEGSALNDALPDVIRQYAAFERQNAQGIDNPPEGVPFEFLTDMKLSTEGWKSVARRMSWTQTRMNLNTLQRHGVFEDAEMVELVTNRLRDKEAIRRSRVFPYQLLMAYTMVGERAEMPTAIKNALQDALDVAVANVPPMPGKVYVFPDVSGSMHSPVTGDQGRGATSKVQCIDVAALVSAAILRVNPLAEVIPFAEDVRSISLNSRDSVMTNAEKLKRTPGGGTNCSAPLRLLNQKGWQADTVIYVSDYESWVDSPSVSHWGNRGSATMQQWEELRSRCPNARMVCIDLTPRTNTQVEGKGRSEILQVGGWSDNAFSVIAQFVNGNYGSEHWVRVINEIDLRAQDAVAV